MKRNMPDAFQFQSVQESTSKICFKRSQFYERFQRGGVERTRFTVGPNEMVSDGCTIQRGSTVALVSHGRTETNRTFVQGRNLPGVPHWE